MGETRTAGTASEPESRRRSRPAALRGGGRTGGGTVARTIAPLTKDALGPRAAVALVLAAAAAAACGPGEPAPSPGAEADSVSATASIGAVTLDARGRPDPALLDRLQGLGATHLALTSFGFQEAADVPEIRMHTDGGWYSESDEGVRTLARQAAERGMGLILKPHLWVGADGESRQDIGFHDDAAWRAWERDYRRFLMHYARLAEEVEAALLVVGTELRRSVRERPGFWRDLIGDVREVYGGRLTYAANWYEEYREVPFWDRLDYVGVQAYFPLTDARDPSLAELRSAWGEHRDALERMHRTVDRPVLFTEIGYRSVADAAAEPWRWPQSGGSALPAEELQARLFRAAFRTMMPEPWFAGAVVWKWRPAGEGFRLTGFTPQGKPAEAVIREWFGGD